MARDGDGGVAMLDEQSHGTRLGDDLFHLLEIHQEGTMATRHHRIGLQIVFHLREGGSQHVGTNLITT